MLSISLRLFFTFDIEHSHGCPHLSRILHVLLSGYRICSGGVWYRTPLPTLGPLSRIWQAQTPSRRVSYKYIYQLRPCSPAQKSDGWRQRPCSFEFLRNHVSFFVLPPKKKMKKIKNKKWRARERVAREDSLIVHQLSLDRFFFWSWLPSFGWRDQSQKSGAASY